MLPRLDESLSTKGYAFVQGKDLRSAFPSSATLAALAAEWDDLGVDIHLPGDIKYRSRRYGRFTLTRGARLEALPHEPFVQSAADIPAYGGRPREFRPLTSSARSNPLLIDLIHFVGAEAIEIWPDVQCWEIGVHMIRIVVSPDNAVSPTPEGRHRDGHSLVGMHLIGREMCDGGRTLLYQSGGDLVSTATLQQPLDSLIVNDKRVEHAVTDLSATDPAAEGRRDLLIIAFYPPSSSKADKARQ
jgi:hypothetical protein